MVNEPRLPPTITSPTHLICLLIQGSAAHLSSLAPVSKSYCQWSAGTSWPPAMMLPIAKALHQSAQSLAASCPLGWPQPAACRVSLPPQSCCKHHKSRQKRRRISSLSHKRWLWGAGSEHGCVCQPPLSPHCRSGEGGKSTKARGEKNNLCVRNEVCSCTGLMAFKGNLLHRHSK